MRESFYRLPGPQRVRLALVSDLHGRPCGAVLASLQERRPGLICIPGDFVHGVAPRTGHTLVAMVRETGVTLLDNAWTRRGPLVIGGLSSAYVTGYGLYRAERGGFPVPENIHHVARGVVPGLGWLTDYTAQEGFHLLLCHHPEYWPRYLRALPIQLTLSGHAHGGQIRLFGQGLYAPGQGLLPNYTSGLYENRLLVSRGLSNNVIIPRLFNPTELVYLDLEA